jgi:opacity protein-like surface antigen
MMISLSTRRAAILLALSSLPPAVLAADAVASPPFAASSYYWGGHVGTNTVGRLDAQVDLGKGARHAGEATLKGGTHGGGFIGGRTAHARYELELASGSLRLTHLTAGPVNANANAHGRYHAAFANVYRTERLSDSFDVFAGAGIGWGRTELDRLGLLHACTCFGSASGKGFAWQLRAGAAFRIDEHSSVALQYSSLHLQPLVAAGPPNVRYERKGFGAWTVAWIQRF